MAAASVTRNKIPSEQSLPRYPIPVIVLTRLAVDSRFQKQGIGEKSLVYALRHAVQLSDSGLPSYGVVLDVKDDAALAFYLRFKIFHRFTNEPMRLFVSMKLLRKT